MKIKGRYQHKQIRSFDNINQELRVSSKPPMNIVIYTFSSSLLQPQNVWWENMIISIADNEEQEESDRLWFKIAFTHKKHICVVSTRQREWIKMEYYGVSGVVDGNQNVSPSASETWQSLISARGRQTSNHFSTKQMFILDLQAIFLHLGKNGFVIQNI